MQPINLCKPLGPISAGLLISVLVFGTAFAAGEPEFKQITLIYFFPLLGASIFFGLLAKVKPIEIQSSEQILVFHLRSFQKIMASAAAVAFAAIPWFVYLKNPLSSGDQVTPAGWGISASWIILSLVVAFVKLFRKDIQVLASGEVVRGKEQLADFGSIERIELAAERHNKKRSYYQVDLHLKDRSKLTLLEGLYKKDACNIAEALSVFTNIEWVEK